MRLALIAVTFIGILLGLALPVARPRGAPAPVVAAPAAAGEDKPVETVLERTPNGHFLAVADVNKEPIRFVVDTGADIVALTMEDAKRAHVDFDPGQFRVVGRGASGDVRGQEVHIDSIVLDGKRATDVRGVVLEGSDISLLGQTYLRHLGEVQISKDRMVLR